MDGQTLPLTTNDYALLYENPILSLNKAAFMNYISSADPVLQSVMIPITDFKSVNPEINLSSIKSITFIFNQSQQGRIWIDDITMR